MNVTSSGANKDAVGAKTKDNSVRDTLAHLMLRNLSEVFGERDSERRMAAIKNLYSEDAVFFEAEQRFEGRQTISDAVAALQASFPDEFEFSAVAPPARNHDVGRLFWRLGPAGSPPVVNGMDVAQFKDGRIHSLYVFLNDEDH
jgi:hypothetical protein